MHHKSMSLIVGFVFLAAVGSCCVPLVLIDSSEGYLLGVLFLFGLLALVGLPILSLLELSRAEHRKKLGLCAHCGYDMRASRRRCPECGRVADSDGPQDGDA